MFQVNVSTQAYYCFFAILGGYRKLIRLRGTDFTSRGRVEVYCAQYGWVQFVRGILMRSRGLPSVRIFQGNSGLPKCTLREGTHPIWLDNVEWSGSEKYLWDCSRNAWGIENCSHSEDARADCA